MKGTIVKCLKNLVEEKFGAEKWQEISNKSNYQDKFINIANDIDDTMVMALLSNTCTTLGITIQQAGDAFGDYWANDYAPKIYKIIYKRYHSAREFILGMDDVHVEITQNVPNAKPPRFKYNFTDDNTLLVTYVSKRKLIDVYVGLVKGLGRYFNEKLDVTKVDDETAKIVFH